MEKLSKNNQVTVLLNILETQIAAMDKKESIEQSLFQWTTSLLLAVFGVIIALADKSKALPGDLLIVLKILATIIVIAPILLTLYWIHRRSKSFVHNAIAVERIQQLLELFDENAYGSHSPYPHEWQGNLVKSRAKRKLPLYYTLVIFVMSASIIMAIWFLL